MELIGMNKPVGPKTILKEIASTRTWYGDDDPNVCPSGFGRSFYVMSVAWDNYKREDHNTRKASTAKRINRFKSYVEKHSLGTVVIAPDTANPVHGGYTKVRSAIYTPNHANLWRHLLEEKIVAIRHFDRTAW
jgi:hypothetical protein